MNRRASSPARVSASLFPTLGVRPALGRLFVENDNLQGHWNVVVLVGRAVAPQLRRRHRRGRSHPHRQRRRRTRSSASCRADSRWTTRASRAARRSRCTSRSRWYEAYTSRSDQFVNVRRVTTIARLAPGVTREQASAELQTIAQGIAAENPDSVPSRRAGDRLSSRRRGAARRGDARRAWRARPCFSLRCCSCW